MRNPSSSSTVTAAKGSAGVTNNNKKKKSGSGSGNGNGSRSNGGAPNTTTVTPCCSKVGLKRGPWTPEEDEVLAEYIRREGEGRWRTLPKRAGLLRCGKSCRLRWMNYLRPSVKRGQIAPDEEDLILRLHRLLGNRWSLIAGRIPGRTDNEIKNYWNTHLSKKLISQGIDPRTHKPLITSTSTTTAPPPPPSSKPPLPPIISNHQINTPSSAPPPPPLITTTVTVSNKEFDHLGQYQATPVENYNNDAYDHIPVADHDGVVSAMDIDHILTSNNNNNKDCDDDDINYCCDDVFSSFLNSLINEDAFAAAQRHGHIDNDIAAAAAALLPSDDDPLISSAPPGYGGSGVWESPLLSAANAFSQNDTNGATGGVDHHHE